MIKLASAFFVCKEENCKWNLRKEYATYNAIFGHYFRKGREVLIRLVKEAGISKNPYGEPTFILAEKLVRISKIDPEYEQE